MLPCLSQLKAGNNNKSNNNNNNNNKTPGKGKNKKQGSIASCGDNTNSVALGSL